jgi:3-methyladenine DNA glycosylase/8-oxoguanine DNA glycosylase
MATVLTSSPAVMPPPLVRVVVSGRPIELRSTLSPLRHGPADPTFRAGTSGSVWWAARTPDGPVSVRFLQTGPRTVAAAAWGDGAGWAVRQLPSLLGELDDPTGFTPKHSMIARSWRERPGWRLGRGRPVVDTVVAVVLEQKVTGKEAHRSWRELVWRFGEPAPGPTPYGLRVPPTAEGWLALPSWEWHLAGVGPDRARAATAACRVASRLVAAAEDGSAELDRALRSVPGIGVWTSAEVRQRVLGDPDAVSVGDYHLPAVIGWALAGRPTDDAGMLALLEPYRGHRHRAVRLIELADGAIGPPRRGPRFAPRDYRSM